MSSLPAAYPPQNKCGNRPWICPPKAPFKDGSTKIKASAAKRRKVELISPPVDVKKSAPGLLDPTSFLQQRGIEPSDITLRSVSRLAGARAFSSAFTPATAGHFCYKGFYGGGDGNSANLRMTSDILALAEHSEDLHALGELSRQFVVQRSSFDVISTQLSRICTDALTDTPNFPIEATDVRRTTAVYPRETRFRRHPLPPSPMTCTDLVPSYRTATTSQQAKADTSSPADLHQRSESI